ncbi:MAG: VanZ family protein [Paramuribaculum sp.]|nr:VanZ family protein [Paramuribaculum sp.]
MNKYRNLLLALNSLPVGMASSVILCLICIMTLMPPSGVPSVSIPNIDKVAHAMFFGVLATSFIFDTSRYLKNNGPAVYLFCAIASALIGAAIEIAQDAMGLGRSGDWMDLLADIIGAFILPLPFLRIITFLATDYSLKLSEVKKSSRIPAVIHKIYSESFPPDEQRPWDSIKKLIDSDKRFHFEIIRIGDNDCGLLTWWKLNGFSYIEHFAINPAIRSQGIGSLTIRRLISHNRKKNIVLEAEPESMGEMASRRIRFYKRLGFIAHHEFRYIQPPYTPESDPVELTLMTSEPSPDLNHIMSTLHHEVYGIAAKS